MQRGLPRAAKWADKGRPVPGAGLPLSPGRRCCQGGGRQVGGRLVSASLWVAQGPPFAGGLLSGRRAVGCGLLLARLQSFQQVGSQVHREGGLSQPLLRRRALYHPPVVLESKGKQERVIKTSPPGK